MRLSLYGPSVRIREQYHFITPERRNELWAAYVASGEFKDLGYMLHATQDQYSHRGFGASIGHALAGKVVDWTAFVPSRGNAMARDSFETLINASGPLGRTGVPWQLVEPFVKRFNDAWTEGRKLQIIDEMYRAIHDYLGGNQ